MDLVRIRTNLSKIRTEPRWNWNGSKPVQNRMKPNGTEKNQNEKIKLKQNRNLT